MATSIVGFNDVRLTQKMIGALKGKLISANAVSFQPDLGANNAGLTKGDIIRVPVMGAATATTRVLGAAGASGGSGTVVPITLADPLSAQWDTIDGATKHGTFEALAIEHTYALAKSALDAIFAVVTATNFGDTAADKLTCALADFSIDQLGLAQALAIAKNIGDDKSLVLNGSYASKLVTSGALGLILATNGNDSIKTGILPPLMGMSCYMYSGLSENAESLVGLITGKSAIAAGIAPVMSQAQAGQGDLVFEQILVDPETGIGMTYRVWYKADEGKMFGRVELMLTAVKVQNALIRIVKA
jgi:hypothetical protein